MAARIPTQNNLGEVIKSLNENLSAFSSLMQIVSGILNDKSVFLRKDFKQVINTIEKNVDKVLGKNGLISNIIHKIRKLPKEDRIKTAVNRIDMVSNTLLKSLSTFVESSNKIFDTLNNLKFMSLLTARIKFYIVTRFIRRIMNWFVNPFRFTKFQMYNVMAQAINLALLQMNVGVRMLARLTESLLEIKVNWIQSMLIRARIKRLKKVIDELIGVGVGKSKTGLGLFWHVLPMTFIAPLVVPALIALTISTFFLALFVRQLRRVRLGFMGGYLMIRRIRTLAKIIKALIRVFRRLSRVRASVILRASITLVLMMMAMRKLTWTLIVIILSIPIYAVFIILSPIILLSFLMIFLIIKGLVLISKLVINRSIYLGLVRLTLVIGMLTAIGILLMVFGLFSLILVKLLPRIILAIMGIGIVMLSIVALSALMGLLAPAIIPMAAGMLLVFVMVTSILLMSVMLMLLTLIKLNKEKILEKVREVIDVAMSISTTVFDGGLSEPEKKAQNTWMGRIVRGLFKGLGMFLEMLFSSLILLTAVVAVFAILLMASMLALLQRINLDPDKVKTNVQVVLDTAKSIITSIFDPKDEREDNEPKSWFKGFIIRIFEGLTSIIEAILAVAFLALTVISVGIIILIAYQLRKISQMDIDAEAAREKAQNIMDAAMAVMNAIFGFKKGLQTPPATTWLGQLIEWAFPDFYKFLQVIESVLFLGLALIGIGCVKKVGEALGEIVKFDVDTETAKKKAQQIVIAAQDIANEINIQGSIFDNIGKKWKLGKVAKMFGDIKLIAETMTYLKDFDLSVITSSGDIANKIVIEAVKLVRGPKGASDTFWRDLNEAYKDISKAMERVSGVFSLFAGLGSSEEDMKKALTTAIYTGECMKQIANADFDNEAVMNKARVIGFASMSLRSWFNMSSAEVALNKQLVEQNIKFFEKINSVDIEKLKTTEKMFRNMAKFSETISGNFEGLADTLNNKIAPIIEELSKKIDDVKALQAEAIDDNNANSGNEKAVSENTATKRVAKAPVGGLIQYGKDQEGDSFTISKESRKAYMRATKNGKDIGAILNVLTGNGGTGGVLTRTR